MRMSLYAIVGAVLVCLILSPIIGSAEDNEFGPYIIAGVDSDFGPYLYLPPTENLDELTEDIDQFEMIQQCGGERYECEKTTHCLLGIVDWIVTFNEGYEPIYAGKLKVVAIEYLTYNMNYGVVVQFEALKGGESYVVALPYIGDSMISYSYVLESEEEAFLMSLLKPFETYKLPSVEEIMASEESRQLKDGSVVCKPPEEDTFPIEPPMSLPEEPNYSSPDDSDPIKI